MAKKVFKFDFLSKYVKESTDRHALFSVGNTIESFVISIIKIVLAIIVSSTWVLVFGIYYGIMFITRVIFLHVYTKERLHKYTEKQDLRYLLMGAITYIVLGIAFVLICMYLYLNINPQVYAKNVMLAIATLGFIKIISSIVGLTKSRKLHSPAITFIKSLNVIDGLMAIIVTQYAILSTESSHNASESTGLFGMGLGSVIILIGLILIIYVHKQKKGS